MPDQGTTVLSLPLFIVNVDESYINKSVKLTLYGKMRNNKPAAVELLRTAVWSVDDTSICKIENDLITPLKNGICYVTATINGISATAKITIGDVTLDRLIVNKTSVVIPLGGIINMGNGLEELTISVSSTNIDLGGIVNINQ